MAPIIRLSPIARLTMTLKEEMKVDKAGVFPDDIIAKYLERTRVAEGKREAAMRSLFSVNAFLAILISGNSLTIPFLNVKTSDIPAILEITTALSAISFAFLALAFINWFAYEQITNSLISEKAIRSGIDPDYVVASWSQTELFLKLFRAKLNIWHFDFFEPRIGYKVFSKVILFMVYIMLATLPVLHLLLTSYSLFLTFDSNDAGLLYVVYMLFVVLCNAQGLLAVFGSLWNFDFEIRDAEQPEDGPRA